MLAPPEGVRWAVQLGRSELAAPLAVERGRVEFEIPLELSPGAGGIPRLRGPAVQGRPGARFLYVNSGTRAGEAGSCWDRRAKVSLESLVDLDVPDLAPERALVLEGEIAGTARDGGPACASVPLLRGAWSLAASTG